MQLILDAESSSQKLCFLWNLEASQPIVFASPKKVSVDRFLARSVHNVLKVASNRGPLRS